MTSKKGEELFTVAGKSDKTDDRLASFFDCIQEKMTEVQGPVFSKIDGAFNSIGHDPQQSQALLNQLFLPETLDLLGHKSSLIRGYVVLLDPFSGRYKSFGRIGNWIDNVEGKDFDVYEEYWWKEWMCGGERLVSEGLLAKCFIEGEFEYLQVLKNSPGKAVVLIQNWNKKGENRKAESAKLNMGWSVTSPVYHLGRIIGFVNMGFREEVDDQRETQAKECAHYNAYTIWWLAQNILSPFLLDAGLGMDDTRLAELLWRASKLDRKKAPDRFFRDKQKVGDWDWLINRVFLICATYRRKTIEEEGQPDSKPDLIKETITNVSRINGIDENEWFKVVIASDVQEIPLPVKVLPGVLVELLSNAFVAVSMLKRKGVQIKPPYVDVEVNKSLGVEGEKISIIVRDKGVGMDDYTVSRAFDLGFSGFIRTDEANGMGLNIVRLNVKKYHGEVKINSSNVDNWTTVTIELPCVKR